MSFKFRVGQKVKFKSADELTKISNYKNWLPQYKALAEKIVKICYTSEFKFGKFSDFGNLYKIKSENELYKVWFEEDYFEEGYFETLVEV